jgi:hypothetical protein
VLDRTPLTRHVRISGRLHQLGGEFDCLDEGTVATAGKARKAR